ncbi:MAG: hypothetical protein DMG88_12215 [Acidobacteria bacterium]|nr:MAG: hypothetical protein DMG88_12215 [Acidobacteriota bacterium]
MNLEQQIVVACVGCALVLGIRAILLPNKRWRLIIPAAALSLLAIYELAMDHWEKTVRAAIRLDMFLEIPLIAVFILWGVVALVYSRSTEK